MKRWLLVIVGVAVIATVVGAGYLGMQSARGQTVTETQAPPTVEVTRGDVQTTVTAPGHLAYSRETTLAFAVGGTLARVNVRPGEQVTAGTVLAQLELEPFHDAIAAAQCASDLARARLAQLEAGPTAAESVAAELALASARVQLQQLQAGPSAAEVAAAEAAIAAARQELAYLVSLPDPIALHQAETQLGKATAVLQQAQAAYDRIKDRPDVGMLPQSVALQQATLDFEAARTNLEAALRPASPAMLEAARARLAAAEAALAELVAGPPAGTLALAELQVEKAGAEVARLNAGAGAMEQQQAEADAQATALALKQATDSLEAATLIAPFDGAVLEVRAQAGAMIVAGAGLIHLADSSALQVETSVIEEDLPLVRPGQPVELYFDARPDAPVAGWVARIVPQRLPGDRPLYPVYVQASTLPAGLLAGMTADASIVIESRQDVLRLPRALVRVSSDGTAAVRVWTGTEVQERLVSTGLRGDAYVEIVAGLHEGDKVVAQ
jgi:HlyD family secretion protein